MKKNKNTEDEILETIDRFTETMTNYSVGQQIATEPFKKALPNKKKDLFKIIESPKSNEQDDLDDVALKKSIHYNNFLNFEKNRKALYSINNLIYSGSVGSFEAFINNIIRLTIPYDKKVLKNFNNSIKHTQGNILKFIKIKTNIIFN